MENNNISEFKVPTKEEAAQIRAQFLKDYPYQEAYEQLAEEYSKDDDCDLVECIMHDRVRNLRLSWAAARAVFGDMATPEMAWKLYVGVGDELDRIDAAMKADREKEAALENAK